MVSQNGVSPHPWHTFCRPKKQVTGEKHPQIMTFSFHTHALHGRPFTRLLVFSLLVGAPPFAGPRAETPSPTHLPAPAEESPAPLAESDGSETPPPVCALYHMRSCRMTCEKMCKTDYHIRPYLSDTGILRTSWRQCQRQCDLCLQSMDELEEARFTEQAPLARYIWRYYEGIQCLPHPEPDPQPWWKVILVRVYESLLRILRWVAEAL